MMPKRILQSLAIFSTTLLLSCARSSGPPYSPQSALKTFKIEAGFHIELFVSEPQISDPVAMEFDEDGRIYVVEMHGYPLDTGPSGRVKLLRDSDGDGRPDLTKLAKALTVLKRKPAARVRRAHHTTKQKGR